MVVPEIFDTLMSLGELARFFTSIFMLRDRKYLNNWSDGRLRNSTWIFYVLCTGLLNSFNILSSCQRIILHNPSVPQTERGIIQRYRYMVLAVGIFVCLVGSAWSGILSPRYRRGL